MQLDKLNFEEMLRDIDEADILQLKGNPAWLGIQRVLCDYMDALYAQALDHQNDDRTRLSFLDQVNGITYVLSALPELTEHRRHFHARLIEEEIDGEH